MRHTLAAAAAVVTIFAAAATGSAQSTPAVGDPRSAAAPAVADTPSDATPWNIYLACRAQGVGRRPALNALCGLRLPAISRSFTGTELREWGAVVSALPTVQTIREARDSAEREMLTAARSLGTASVGNREFSFEFGVDTLSALLQRRLEQQAAAAKLAFDVDSQAVEVVGFADYAGNTASAATQALAKRRAEYVAGFLRRAGIPNDRITPRIRLVPNPRNDSTAGQRFRMAAVGGGGSSSTLVAPAAEGGRRTLGLSPAQLAVGASDFLVERARAELQTYVLRIGVNRICLAATWRALLRATCALLPEETDSVRYVPGAGALQGALRADLREMPYVVTETTLLDLADTLQRRRPDSRALERARVAVALVRYLRAVAGGTEPLAALAAWEGPAVSLGGRTVTLPPRLRQVATVARFASGARADLSSQLSGTALADTAALYVLKALLVHGAAGGADNLWTGWAADAQRVNAALAAVRTAQRVAVDVESDWRALRTAARDSASTTRRAEIVSELVSTATSLLAVDVGVAGVRPDSALQGVVLEPARDLVVALAGDDPRAAVNSLVRLLQAGADDGVVRIPQEYTRVLGFANDAAQARTTSEFSGALENLAGPQGGYLSKREAGGRWYARLNAFVGGNVSGESTSADGSASGQGLAVGLTVPIGVEIGTAGRTRRSNGVFLQFIDLGAVASARIAGNDDVESLPDFKLGTLVGPGVFWAHGYKDSPLSSAMGVAYFPQGRLAADGSRVGVVRASVMIAIDIPLFP